MAGGFEEFANRLSREHRRLRSRRNRFGERRKELIHTRWGRLNSVKLSPEERSKMKSRVRKTLLRRRMRNLLANTLGLAVAVLVVVLIYHLFFANLQWLRELP